MEKKVSKKTKELVDETTGKNDNFVIRKQRLKKEFGFGNLFRYFLKEPKLSNKNYSAPYREDSNPSYQLKKFEESGNWKGKDWSLDEKFHDVFELAKRVFKSETFEEVLDKLEQETPKIKKWLESRVSEDDSDDVTEGENEQDDSYNSSKVCNQMHRRALNYWKKEGISEDTLNHYNVEQLSWYSNKGYEFHLTVGVKFAFKYSPVEGWQKVYQPLKKPKCFYLSKSDRDLDYIFGLDQLPAKGEILVITGGEKDVMSLYEAGLPAVCGMSESTGLKEETMKQLRSRFRDIVVMFDNDEAGNMYSKGFSKEFGIVRVQLPDMDGVKDVTEWRKADENADVKIRNLVKKAVRKSKTILNPNEPYIVTWDTLIKPQPPTLEINDVPVGSTGNVFLIMASPGVGKSAICEMIISSYEQTDKEQEEITINSSKKVLMIDTERSKVDVSKCFNRICGRVGVDEPEKLKKISLWSLTHMTDTEKKMSVIRRELSSGEYSMLIIDGSSDFVKNPNDMIESNDFVDWLRELALLFDLTIVTTIHTNPSDGKPRGHLGSELLRRAETVASVEVQDINDNRLHCLTTKGKFGKTRNTNKQLEMFFEWNDDKGMFTISDKSFVVDAPKKNLPKVSNEDLKSFAIEVFEDEESLKHKDLVERLAEATEISKDTIRKSYIERLIEMKAIEKRDNQYYLIAE